MAITIIGAKPDTPEPTTLPVPDVELPPPTTVPEAQPILDAGALHKALANESPVVRSFAIEQAAHRDGEEWAEAITKLVDDPDDSVAADAMGALESLKHAGAVEVIAKRFETASGELAAAAASALGRLAPDRLLELVRARGRLDDEGYAATATALAIIGSDEVVDFLDKALNRSGALSPERRSALCGAALLSGSTALAARVIGMAVADSQRDEPEGATYPARAAVGALAGLPIAYSTSQRGLEVYDHVREILETDVIPSLSDDQTAAVEETLKRKRLADVLEALRPVLQLEMAGSAQEESEGDLGSIPRRRAGLLEALIAQKETIGELELKAGALFMAAAAQAASVVAASRADEASTPAMAALSKALGGTPSASALGAMSDDELVELFESRTDHDLRRVFITLTRERFRRATTLQRFAEAALEAGRGIGLLQAAAEVDDEQIQRIILAGTTKNPAAAEAAVLELLQTEPLEARSAAFTLAVAERVRTERVALAIGRKFMELRRMVRGTLSRALLRLASPRLLPLLESRAFPDEPEEVTWAVLSLVEGAPLEGRLQEVLERVQTETAEEPQGVRLSLRCEACDEVLSYRFERVYLDIEAKDPSGDPAFVGPVVCKACGTEDRLEQTETSARILTAHMLQFLEDTRAGRMTAPPLVSPAQTQIMGRKLGLAQALRTLNEEIEASPSSIPRRLARARLRMMLRRPHADDDVEAVLDADPDSVEALTLRASLTLSEGKRTEAMAQCADVWRRLAAEEAPKLYETPSPDHLRTLVEDHMVRLEQASETVPEGVELGAARKRWEERAQEAELLMRRMAEEQQAQERPKAEPQQPQVDRRALEAALKKAGRNDPCPCGSGKKFKKCHGRGR